MKRDLLALLVLACGCAVGQQLVAPRHEYDLYRATHVAPTLEQRLAAANRYLHLAPEGVYAGEVKAWFAGAEPSYLARAHDQLPMLEAYASGLPDGPSISVVRARIEELESAARFAAHRETARNERVESLEAGLERAATQRKAFSAEITGWIGALAAVRSYGQPLAALPPDVRERFAISDPAQGCPLDVCARGSAPRFAIPHAQAHLVPREAPYTVELSLAGGLLVSLRLHGPELFSRLGEALELRPVSFADPQSRTEAIGSALVLIGNALGAALSAPGCDEPAVSPVILARTCDGVHLSVTAATDAGGEDVLAFGPATPPAAPSAATPAPAAPKRQKH